MTKGLGTTINDLMQEIDEKHVISILFDGPRKNELFIALTEDFSKAVREYRKARTGTDSPMLEFCGKIIESKIQVIAAIGGFMFMQEFHNFLYQYRKYENLNLASAFNWYADGIGGWCR
jgi:hypothetical protein